MSKDLSSDHLPSVTPFWRTLDHKDKYSLIVQTEPIFQNIPKNAPLPKMSHDDIGSKYLFEYIFFTYLLCTQKVFPHQVLVCCYIFNY